MTPRPPQGSAERLDWLRLIRSENVGPITFYQLLAPLRLGARRRWRRCPRSRGAAAGRARSRICSQGRGRARACGARQSRAPSSSPGASRTIPPALAAVDDAPPLIAAAGPVASAEKRARWRVVGARNASANGRRFARDIALQLGSTGWWSSRAWRAASTPRRMRARLPTGTIAVLAGGIDRSIPRRTARCTKRSPSAACCWPRCRSAPSRRRAISRAATASSPACALGVLVVEAALALGLAHHRALRARAGPRGLRRAGLAARSALPRHQRSDPPAAPPWSRAPTTSWRSLRPQLFEPAGRAHAARIFADDGRRRRPSESSKRRANRSSNCCRRRPCRLTNWSGSANCPPPSC